MGCGYSKRVNATLDDEHGEAFAKTACKAAVVAFHEPLLQADRLRNMLVKPLPCGAVEYCGLPTSLLHGLPPGDANGDGGAQSKPCSVEPFVQSPGELKPAALMMASTYYGKMQ